MHKLMSFINGVITLYSPFLAGLRSAKGGNIVLLGALALYEPNVRAELSFDSPSEVPSRHGGYNSNLNGASYSAYAVAAPKNYTTLLPGVKFESGYIPGGWIAPQSAYVSMSNPDSSGKASISISPLSESGFLFEGDLEALSTASMGCCHGGGSIGSAKLQAYFSTDSRYAYRLENSLVTTLSSWPSSWSSPTTTYSAAPRAWLIGYVNQATPTSSPTSALGTRNFLSPATPTSTTSGGGFTLVGSSYRSQYSSIDAGLLPPGDYLFQQEQIASAKYGTTQFVSETASFSVRLHLRELPSLYLDFEHPVSSTFAPIETVFGTIFEESPGQTHEVGTWTDAQKGQLIQAVQNIFDRSGAPLLVTDKRPAKPALSVRFSSDLIQGNDGRLLGIAHNVTKDVFAGVDRFDRWKGGEVAVFLDPSRDSDSIYSIAETVAHEAGHGYGLRHVNPSANFGAEVMDYSAHPVPKFLNIVSSITEPPGPGGVIGVTHNPAYHLRRYVIGESDAELRMAGIDPGFWDKQSYEQYELEFFGDVIGTIAKIGFVGDSSITMSPDLASEARLFKPVVISQEGKFSFNVPHGESFRLIGASSEGALDIAFGFETAEGPVFDLSAEDLSHRTALSLFKLDAGVAANIGQIGVRTLSITTVSAVPVPSGFWLLASAAGSLLLARARRRENSPRHCQHGR